LNIGALTGFFIFLSFSKRPRAQGAAKSTTENYNAVHVTGRVRLRLSGYERNPRMLLITWSEGDVELTPSFALERALARIADCNDVEELPG
jgi:hypothetical protein